MTGEPNAAGEPVEAPFERVIRMRIALAIGLAIPLGFFVFLVLHFKEEWWLALVGVAVYLYILGQFFLWQNPRRKASASTRKEPGP